MTAPRTITLVIRRTKPGGAEVYRKVSVTVHADGRVECAEPLKSHEEGAARVMAAQPQKEEPSDG